MTTTRATTSETEAQLETRAKEALLKALPWLGGHKIEQQVTFTLRFGHAEIIVDGKSKEYVSGRCDILISVDDVYTLVLELKRPGKSITNEDIEQGLSYARVLHPRPPLVLATDGSAQRLVETHTGEEWTPVEKDEKALKALLENIAMVSADDLKRAVSRLLGNDPSIWVKAARAVSKSFVDERMGDGNTPYLPFLDEFLVPRHAVRDAISALTEGDRLVLIDGAPLAGKSSALRELAEVLEESDNFSVMLLDADSGLDLFTSLADIMSIHFLWPLTAFEARHWVQQLSHSTGHTLVLAVDDFDGSRGSFRRDLEALTSELFGDRVRVVLALDEGAAQRLSLASNGRAPSILMRRGAKSMPIGKLNDDEFKVAKLKLEGLGLLIMPGGEYTPALRQPWVLRLMCSQALAEGRPSEKSFAMLPSVPDLHLLQSQRHQPGFETELLGRYREVAQALFNDVLEGGQSRELRLDSLEAFLVRREALRKLLGENEIRELLQAGLLDETRSDGGEAVFVIKIPNVLASELAHLITQEVLESSDAESLAKTLSHFAGSIPLGSVVVTNGIIDAAAKNEVLGYELFEKLMAIVPRRENLPEGTIFALRMPDGQHVDIKIVDSSRIEMHIDGETHSLELDDEEHGETTEDVEAWTILSYLATQRIAVENTDGSQISRLDVQLLLMIGSYPGPLVEVSGRDEPLALHTHSLPRGGKIICSTMGIVEPITYAIYLLFKREPDLAREFVDAAIKTESLALMLRIHTALSVFHSYSEKYANLDRDVIRPAIGELMGSAAIDDHC